MERAYDGPSSGLGAVYAWKGNSKAGEGRMEIIESQPQQVGVDLLFAAPMKAHNRVDFTLTPVDGGQRTHVVWAMTGPQNVVMRLMSKVWSMEKMIGPDLERGLSQAQAGRRVGVTAASTPSGCVIRTATREDVPAMVAMLADDPLGAAREDPADAQTYAAAYEPRGQLTPRSTSSSSSATGASSEPSSSASSPASPAAARPARSSRGFASRRTSAATASAPSSSPGPSRSRAAPAAPSCSSTSDASRTDARRFYERLGFEASHIGFKLPLHP